MAPVMDEDQFWSFIGELGGSTDEPSMHRLWLRLRRTDDPELILDFYDRLCEVLHRLDRREIAKQRWRSTEQPWWAPRMPGISADGFLYARCAAVAEGRQTVEAVLRDSRAFRRRWSWGEELLFVAPKAYEATARREFPYDRDTAYSYETGSNPDGGWKRAGSPPGNPQ